MTKRMARVAFLFCATTAISASAQTFTTLVNFNNTDGATPQSSLVQGTDGNLYGTTLQGATGDGTVFKMAPDGMVITLHSFCRQNGCTDGASPEVGLTLGTDGDFYGTTFTGGAQVGGTLYKITREGLLTVLYSFCSQANCSDGYAPWAVPIQGTDGNFYGTTFSGGAYGSAYGTVYKITPQGVLTTLHSFDGVDGSEPAGLVQAMDGDFYGTTGTAGAYGQGTVFKITPDGDLTTLHSFCSEAGCPDGTEPRSGLLQARNGNFYGTTYEGGVVGHGTVFEITAGGVLTTLDSFDTSDGAYPNGLVQATDGNFYGTTFLGGNGYGTVFEITAQGALTVLHSFDITDGTYASAGMSQATSGQLYGTTVEGGANVFGTVFSLSVGLGSFIKTIPTAGRVGENIMILGDGLKGSTTVSFNGTPATTFTTSNSAIRVTVPAGATTGSIEVVTALGRLLKSNAKFRIIP